MIVHTESSGHIVCMTIDSAMRRFFYILEETNKGVTSAVLYSTDYSPRGTASREMFFELAYGSTVLQMAKYHDQVYVTVEKRGGSPSAARNYTLCLVVRGTQCRPILSSVSRPLTSLQIVSSLPKDRPSRCQTDGKGNETNIDNCDYLCTHYNAQRAVCICSEGVTDCQPKPNTPATTEPVTSLPVTEFATNDVTTEVTTEDTIPYVPPKGLTDYGRNDLMEDKPGNVRQEKFTSAQHTGEGVNKLKIWIGLAVLLLIVGLMIFYMKCNRTKNDMKDEQTNIETGSIMEDATSCGSMVNQKDAQSNSQSSQDAKDESKKAKGKKRGKKDKLPLEDSSVVQISNSMTETTEATSGGSNISQSSLSKGHCGTAPNASMKQSIFSRLGQVLIDMYRSILYYVGLGADPYTQQGDSQVGSTQTETASTEQTQRTSVVTSYDTTEMDSSSSQTNKNKKKKKNKDKKKDAEKSEAKSSITSKSPKTSKSTYSSQKKVWCDPKKLPSALKGNDDGLSILEPGEKDRILAELRKEMPKSDSSKVKESSVKGSPRFGNKLMREHKSFEDRRDQRAIERKDLYAILEKLLGIKKRKKKKKGDPKSQGTEESNSSSKSTSESSSKSSSSNSFNGKYEALPIEKSAPLPDSSLLAGKQGSQLMPLDLPTNDALIAPMKRETIQSGLPEKTSIPEKSTSQGKRPHISLSEPATNLIVGVPANEDTKMTPLSSKQQPSSSSVGFNSIGAKSSHTEPFNVKGPSESVSEDTLKMQNITKVTPNSSSLPTKCANASTKKIASLPVSMNLSPSSPSTSRKPKSKKKKRTADKKSHKGSKSARSKKSKKTDSQATGKSPQRKTPESDTNPEPKGNVGNSLNWNNKSSKKSKSPSSQKSSPGLAKPNNKRKKKKKKKKTSKTVTPNSSKSPSDAKATKASPGKKRSKGQRLGPSIRTTEEEGMPKRKSKSKDRKRKTPKSPKKVLGESINLQFHDNTSKSLPFQRCKSKRDAKLLVKLGEIIDRASSSNKKGTSADREKKKNKKRTKKSKSPKHSHR